MALEVNGKQVEVDEEGYLSNLTTNIEIVDYKGFVKLVANNEKTQNWL